MKTRAEKKKAVLAIDVVRSPLWSKEHYAKALAVAKTVGRPICGARNRKGTPCRRAPEGESGRCRLHGARGGRTPTHGKYARYRTLSAEALAEYQHFLDDPDIASIDEEIALTRARISAAIRERLKWAAIFDDEELIKLVSSEEHPETFDGQPTPEQKALVKKLRRGERIARLIYGASVQEGINIERLRKLIETRERRRREGYIARDDVVAEFEIHFGAFFRALESRLGDVLTAEIFGIICRMYVRDVGAPAETVVEITASSSDAGRALVEAWRAMKAAKKENEK